MMANNFLALVKQPTGSFAIDADTVNERVNNYRKITFGLIDHDGISERIFGMFGERYGGADIETILDQYEDPIDIPDFPVHLGEMRILGEYTSNSPREIDYYCSDLDTKEQRVVAIHERFHAVHHLLLDAKRNIWINFPQASSFFKELLAQLFTYLHCQTYERNLVDSFLNLNSSQSIIYRTWLCFRDYTLHEATRLYWEIRSRILSGKVIGGVLGQLEAKIIESFHRKPMPSSSLTAMERKKLFVWRLAAVLVADDRRASGQDLACILNTSRLHSGYAPEYGKDGRGIYTLIRQTVKWLRYDLGLPTEADKVETAFTNKTGRYAY